MEINSLMYVALAYDLYKNKIDGQIAAFNNLGVSVFLCCYNREKQAYQCILTNNHERNVVESEIGHFSKGKYTKFIYKFMQKISIDSIYIRRPGISILSYEKIIKRIRTNKLKFIFEIPTFPLDCPGHNPIRKLVQQVEKAYLKKRVLPYADCIPIFLRDKKVVLSKKMIPSSNCVDFEKYKKYAEAQRSNHDTFNMLAVAFTQKWHGFDRIIKSIEAYKGKQKVKFTLYGNFSDETRKLIAYCKTKNISNVEFLEEKDVGDLLTFYTSFDIGIGTLGLHRIYHTNPLDLRDTSIKNKEYCAMGLPFIHASVDDSFTDDFIYHKLIPADESIIDITELLQWVKTLDMTNSSRNEMSNFAKQKLSFENYANNILCALSRD